LANLGIDRTVIENRDIQQGAITATKLSKNLRLPLVNIEVGTEGQVPIVQSNGDLAYKAVTGAVTIDSDGLTEMSLTTDTVPEGSSNLYYTDDRVDARIRRIKNFADQQATQEEPGFMPKEDKVKLDATADPVSAIRKHSVTISWLVDSAGATFTGAGSTAVGTISHPLDTKAIVVSIQDSAGRWQDIEYDPFIVTVTTANEIQIGIEATSTPVVAGVIYLVTIIG
jgi:hypothetical protein